MKIHISCRSVCIRSYLLNKNFEKFTLLLLNSLMRSILTFMSLPKFPKWEKGIKKTKKTWKKASIISMGSYQGVKMSI